MLASTSPSFACCAVGFWRKPAGVYGRRVRSLLARMHVLGSSPEVVDFPCQVIEGRTRCATCTPLATTTETTESRRISIEVFTVQERFGPVAGRYESGLYLPWIQRVTEVPTIAVCKLHMLMNANAFESIVAVAPIPERSIEIYAQTTIHCHARHWSTAFSNPNH